MAAVRPPWARLRILLLAVTWAPAAVGQYGDFGGGGGGANFKPPAPICPAFKCPAKQKAVARADTKVWSYGCEDSGGMSFMNAGSFDPNNPMAGLKKPKTANKCCIEKDICHRTCGMDSKTCHDNFQKCADKVCKGDQQCNMMAQLSDIMNAPLDDYKDSPPGADADKDIEDRKCRPYNQAQKESCECVPTDEWQGRVEDRLKAFYGTYNPEKLTKKGNIKDVKSIWKQWKGKEPQMFMELTKKYKDKAVEIRKKPKPDYSKYDKKSDSDDGAEDPEDSSSGAWDAAGGDAAEEEKAAPTTTPEPAGEDFLRGKFTAQLRSLESRKVKASADEDYDLAGDLKSQVLDLKRAEVERVRAAKKAAIEAEDYLQAKDFKNRIRELDPKDEF